ncbi:MAG: T9SS type A sorting domain-containing protein [bacterium]|nr:T9SS type A sorting domain-containing protein [bacterium]
MKAFLVMLVIVSLSVAVHAQPQAPVTWGEARWAHLAGWPGLPQITTLRVIPMGDTLLYTALNAASPVSDTILVSSSFDNGQTFTPWHGITQGNEAVSAQFAASAGRLYCFVNRHDPSPSAIWLVTSDDGGRNWGPPQQYRENASIFRGFASGNEVLAKYAGPVNGNPSAIVIHSTDRGQSWSDPVVIDTADFYMYSFDQTIAFTAGHRLILEMPVESLTRPYWLYVARGDSTGQNWTPFQVLPCEYYDDYACQHRAAIIADTASEASGVLGIFGDWDAFAPMTPFFFRTTDGGQSWESCVQMAPARTVPIFTTDVPLNIGAGKLWLVGWSHVQPQWGDYLAIRFSANRGKNWYPIQMAADSLFSSLSSNVFSGQIRGNVVDLYWTQYCQVQGPLDYRMVSGTITPDTVPPVVAVTLVGPDTIRVGDTLRFDGAVFDNDTLSEVRLVVLDSAEQRSVVALAYMGNHVFEGSFIVPSAGQFRYRGEAEDFWENISTYPDSGWLSFVTEGWSAAGNFIPHPSSLSFSVSPNPFNSTTQIEFTLPSTERVSLRLYDVLGREVAVMMNEIQNAGRHRLTFDASGLPSGVYLCRLEAGGMAQTRKMVLIK